jgi:hypothetical protein
MKVKTIIIAIVIAAGLLWWNIAQLPDFRPDPRKIKAMTVPESIQAQSLDWRWFDRVKVEVKEGQCRLISLPPELEAVDGKEVIAAGASFACGDQIVQDETGYTIKGFIIVPYFGMIDCCIGNPVPYFQWTIVVDPLQTPWRIHHTGIVDPTVAVRGVFRVVRERSSRGIFFLDQARVVHSAEQDKHQQQSAQE